MYNLTTQYKYFESALYNFSVEYSRLTAQIVAFNSVDLISNDECDTFIKNADEIYHIYKNERFGYNEEQEY